MIKQVTVERPNGTKDTIFCIFLEYFKDTLLLFKRSGETIFVAPPCKVTIKTLKA